MASVEKIAERFGRAAETYDKTASVQEYIAGRLVQNAIRKTVQIPAAVLDAGCGTGFVAGAIAREWPLTAITAMDNSPAMLAEAQRKVPYLRGIKGDMAKGDFAPAFDLIISSMALHWLDHPRAALERWRQWLRPQGRIFAALPVAGNFAEWRACCAHEGQNDALWPLPHVDFADGLVAETEIELIAIDYASARDFLRRLKGTGAATPCIGHSPIAAPAMRRILAYAPKPFTVTYRILYLEIR
jgi:malonyl-ACP O-methyltransferase BioC